MGFLGKGLREDIYHHGSCKEVGRANRAIVANELVADFGMLRATVKLGVFLKLNPALNISKYGNRGIFEMLT